MKPVLFFSSLCPDTAPFKKVLEQLNVEYDEINITDSMRNLKQFLKLRDTQSVFEAKKATDQVGIPCLVVNEMYLFTTEQLMDYYG